MIAIRKLPNERASLTHAFKLFVKMDRQGSEVSGFADAWAISVSKLLQRGESLEAISDKFRNMRFEPSGITEHPHIRFAQSPIDYIAKWLYGKFVDPQAREEWRERVRAANPGAVFDRSACGRFELAFLPQGVKHEPG